MFFSYIAYAFIVFNFYLGKKFYNIYSYLLLKRNKKVSLKIFLLVYTLCSLPFVLPFMLSSSSGSGFLMAFRNISYYVLIFFLYAGIFFLLSELVLLGLKLFKVYKKPVSKKLLFKTSCIVLAASFLMFSYNSINALFIKTVSYEVETTKSSSINELNIAFISDLHLGYDEKYLERIVDKVNSLNPDIILLGGDIFDGRVEDLTEIDALKIYFSNFKSKYGTFACLGNHDRRGESDLLNEILSDGNVQVLYDEFMNFDNEFILVGRRDLNEARRGTRKEINYDSPEFDKNLPIIVIDHQPNAYTDYPDFVDLILSGHTHRGQIIPLNFITSMVHIQDYGYYRESGNRPQMIVSSGVGTWGPRMRSGSSNEILNIKFVFSQKS